MSMPADIYWRPVLWRASMRYEGERPAVWLRPIIAVWLFWDALASAVATRFTNDFFPTLWMDCDAWMKRNAPSR